MKEQGTPKSYIWTQVKSSGSAKVGYWLIESRWLCGSQPLRALCQASALHLCTIPECPKSSSVLRAMFVFLQNHTKPQHSDGITESRQSSIFQFQLCILHVILVCTCVCVWYAHLWMLTQFELCPWRTQGRTLHVSRTLVYHSSSVFRDRPNLVLGVSQPGLGILLPLLPSSRTGGNHVHSHIWIFVKNGGIQPWTLILEQKAFLLLSYCYTHLIYDFHFKLITHTRYWAFYRLLPLSLYINLFLAFGNITLYLI